MGAKNVSACYVLWSHLDHAPFRLLVGMALQSLDQSSAEGRPARVYFGGEDALVELLGRTRSPAYKALSALKKAGAIEALDVGRKGHRAVYKLALDPLSPPQRVAVTDTSKGRGNRHGKGRGNRDQRVAVTDTPRSTEEGTEEITTRRTSPPAVVSPAPDAPVDNPEFDDLTTEQANRELIKRHGLEHGVNLLAQHGASHPQCENPAGHVLATTPSFTVIKGGAA